MSMGNRSSDPRVQAYAKLIERLDALAGINDPETLLRTSEGLLSNLGDTLKQAGFGEPAAHVFKDTLPEFDRKNPMHVSNFQKAAMELIHRVLAPLMPGSTGQHFVGQLYSLSQGDDAPLFTRTHIGSRQVPNLITYNAAKNLLVVKTRYDAALVDTHFVALLASRVPSGLGGVDHSQVRRDWVRGKFVDQDLADTCEEAGQARRLATPLTPEQKAAEAVVKAHTVQEIVAAINETRRKA